MNANEMFAWRLNAGADSSIAFPCPSSELSPDAAIYALALLSDKASPTLG